MKNSAFNGLKKFTMAALTIMMFAALAMAQGSGTAGDPWFCGEPSNGESASSENPARSTVTAILTDGKLILRTSGNLQAMAHYANGSDAPWYGSRDAITEVIIDHNVSRIGNRAFQNMKNLESVTIGSSVATVGIQAFLNGTGLKTITFVSRTAPALMTNVFAGVDKSLINLYFPHASTSAQATAFRNWGDGGFAGYYSTVFDELNSTRGLIYGVLMGDTLKVGGFGAIRSHSSTSAHWGIHKQDIVSVIIKNGVTHTGTHTFAGCSSLVSVKIPNSVTVIGEGVFSRCIQLASIEIPNSVTSISNNAFYGCTSLSSITIPNSVTSIGSTAFSLCTGLETVTIPNSVTSIAASAFYGSGLESVDISANVRSIGEGAFGACRSLTSINVALENPNYCSIDGVLLNKAQDSLLQYPCNKQGAYTVPANVRVIASRAFAEGQGLTSIVIGGDVRTIGDLAFRNAGLTSVIIGNGVTNIGSGAFERCANLTSVIIGGGVRSLENNVFSNCPNLTSVTIGAAVSSISGSAFSSSTGITTIISARSTPPTANSGAFSSINKTNACLYVSEDRIDAYAMASQWSTFTCIKTFEEDLYTIRFNSEGGNTVSSQYVMFPGGIITRPAPPTRTGHVFEGWYTSLEYTTPWNFDTDEVTSNITLYARWSRLQNAMPAVILWQPLDTSLSPSDYYTFRVTARSVDGGTLSYQWYVNGQNSNTGGTAIPGATGTTYVPDTWDGGTYYYYVVVSNTNENAAVGKTTAVASRAARLDVNGSVIFADDFGSSANWQNEWRGGTGANQKNRWVHFRGTNVNSHMGIYNDNTSSVTQYFTDVPSIDHIYQDISFPVADSDFIMYFHYRGMGEMSGDNYIDFTTISYSDPKFTPRNGSAFTEGKIAKRLANVGSSWQELSVVLPAADFSGKIMRIVFTWTNDGSRGEQPPAAIDNILIVSNDNLPPTHKITFDPTGGRVRPSYGSVGPNGTLVNLPVATRSGYAFDGWFTAATGGTAVTTGTKFNSDATIYARWLPIYTVSFNLGGASGTVPSSISAKSGSVLSAQQAPSTSAYTIFGQTNGGIWYTRTGVSPNFTYTPFIFGEGGTPVTDNITLYLRWVLDTEFYDANIEGDGTADNPYIIANAKQLAYMSLKVNEGDSAYASAYYKADAPGGVIDLSAYGANFNSGRGWIPIGRIFERPFRGAFDGNRHIITGLYINNPNVDHAGLFGYVWRTDCDLPDSYITYLGLVDVDITGRRFVGAVAGSVGSYGDRLHCEPTSGIIGCYSSGVVRGTSESVGGIVGSVGPWAYTKECYSTAAVFGTYSSTGGIAGSVSGEVHDNVALNPSVTASRTGESASRVVGENAGNWILEMARNYAFRDMLNTSGTTDWPNKALNGRNGADILISTILTLPDLNGYFNAENGFSIASGFLPGFGAPVPMPEHLGGDPPVLYTITFNANGGTVTAESAKTRANGTLASLPAPTRNGYSFNGWFTALTGGTQVTTGTVFTANDTVYARWTPVTYTITYVLDGGTVTPVNPSNYTVETETFSLNEPARAGYTFDGWTGTGITDMQSVVTITKGSTGNRTYTANWTSDAVTNAARPTITTQPFGGTITAGTAHLLSVSASVSDGGTLSYIWYRNTSASNTGGTAINGAASAEYSPSTADTGTFYYYVEITNTNNSVSGNKTAMIKSNAVTLVVSKSTSISPNDRTRPNVSPETGVVIGAKSFEFTAGPNPVSKSDGVINFFVTGNRITKSNLKIYDAAGNAVRKINIRDKGGNFVGANAPAARSPDAGTLPSNGSRRVAGSWDLKDAKGRFAAEGTYVLKGTITVDGKREKVSAVIGLTR